MRVPFVGIVIAVSLLVAENVGALAYREYRQASTSCATEAPALRIDAPALQAKAQADLEVARTLVRAIRIEVERSDDRFDADPGATRSEIEDARRTLEGRKRVTDEAMRLEIEELRRKIEVKQRELEILKRRVEEQKRRSCGLSFVDL